VHGSAVKHLALDRCRNDEQHLKSAANRADILTKPVSTKVFETLRDVILNVRRTAVNLHAIVASKMPF
jgi:hypothetical protein